MTSLQSTHVVTLVSLLLAIVLSFSGYVSASCALNCQNGGSVIADPETGSPCGSCQCPSGWDGLQCDQCRNDNACAAQAQQTGGNGTVCSQDVLNVRVPSSFFCNVDLLGIKNELTMTCSDNGVCDLRVWNVSDASTYYWGCTFSQCQYVDGEKPVECSEVVCACNPASPWPCGGTDLDNLLSSLAGPGSVTCGSTSNNDVLGRPTSECEVQAKNLILKIRMDCQVGYCVALTEDLLGVRADDRSAVVAMSIIFVIAFIGTLILFAAVYWRNSVNIKNIALYPRDDDDNLIAAGAASSNHNVDLVFDDLGCIVPGRTILQGVSGRVSTGQTLAIMGNSGSGKTTFINVLAGRIAATKHHGEVRINGESDPSGRMVRSLAAYVTQDADTRLLPHLTVRETVYYSAVLRLPSSIPSSVLQARVNWAIEEVALTQVADSRVGGHGVRGLSGGERRRLSIAVELVTQPPVLFCDEPTSGLDSVSAYQVVASLTRLAQANRIVIFSIHQPRSAIFQLFDKLMILKDGQQVYFGAADSLEREMESLGHPCPKNFSPADHVLDLLAQDVQFEQGDAGSTTKSSDSSAEASSSTQASTTATGTTSTSRSSSVSSKKNRVHARSSDDTTNTNSDGDDSSHFRQSSGLYSFWYLSQRSALHLLRNPLQLRLQILVTLLVALMCGAIFWDIGSNLAAVQDRTGAFFFILTYFAFTSLASVDSFFQERLQLDEERLAGWYGTGSYFVSKLVCDIIPMTLLPAVAFGLISYHMMGLQNNASAFIVFLSGLSLANLASVGVTISVGIASATRNIANTIASLILLVSLIFAGLLFNKNSTPVWLKWLEALSIYNYAFEALSINEFKDLGILFDPEGVTPVLIRGEAILDQLGMDEHNLTQDVGVLIGFTIALYLLAFVLLLFLRRGPARPLGTG